MAAMAALCMFALLGSSDLANAQGNSKHKQMKNEQKAARQAQELEAQRVQLEAQRRAEPPPEDTTDYEE